ncbi:MAG TPA: hypothetical protein ENF22_02450 [Chloroflexi bacterium]|nr:hypothetical protein [Chloroflexota bacterium]
MESMKKRVLSSLIICTVIIAGTALIFYPAQASPLQQGSDANPPDRVVKLIFIHHSTGENWLTDGYGNLGQALAGNNYYVSDTNYGWGPHSIGDRTDIPDWEEWFRSGNTPAYMEALFDEGDKHADYTRTGADPGGENEIVMFKSCFPNSDLEGRSGDPPSADGWLSVGHAKYVYNEILSYFGQHPERLFVVITAPPLRDRGNAANARAFNLWLMNDWLTENDYPYQNVAVFDFYNVLTGNDGHHTFENGQEVHQIAKKDTLKYPSGDDHPSRKGSQKATDEFIPLLNYFYNRWQAEKPTSLPPISEDTSGDSSQADEYIPAAAAPELSSLIDSFDGVSPAGTNGWEAYWEECTPSSLECAIDSGAGTSENALRLDYQITPYSWGTCGLYYDQPQDWSDSMGLAFMVHAGQSGGTLHVDLFVESAESSESYLYELNLEPGMEDEWVQVGIVWDHFQRVDWEEDAGSPFKKEAQISGIAFGFGTEENKNEGVLWLDDLGWMTPREDVGEEITTPAEPESEPDSQEETGGFNLPCIGSLALPIGLVGAAYFQRTITKKGK